MAWEWVAPVCTASVGIAGIIGAVWTAAKGRNHAEKVAEARNKHDRELAREQRVQQRRAEAYIELLTLTEEVGRWARSLFPGPFPDEKDLDLPKPEDHARPNALIMAYGSSTALAYYDTWANVVDELYVSVGLATYSKDRDEDAVFALQMEVDRLKSAEQAARRALADELSAELNGAQRVEAVLDLSRSAEPDTR